MKTSKGITILLFLPFFLIGCFSGLKSISYNASFETIDESKDGVITLEEFTNHFPEAKKQFPPDSDADKDGKIYPDEWFEFRDKKGYFKNTPDI